MRRRDDRGFVLVAALWLLAGLAALVSAYTVFAVETAPSAALPEERLRAEAALRAGVELCAFRELSWPKTTRPDGGAFATRVGDNRVEVRFRSESARVDLNAASRDLLVGLFVELGAAKSQAGFVADRVVGWRDRLSDGDRRKETDIYRKAGLSYGPRGAAFDNTLELALLPGVTPALMERAAGFVTIFGAGKIDPLVADPLVLAALPGATPEIVGALTAAQRGPPPTSDALSRMAGAAKDFVAIDPNAHVRAEIVATVNQRPIHASVVLKINDTGSVPYDILYWRDDFDGARPGD